TDLLPPVPNRARREPDLLTHREPDYDEEYDDLDEDRPTADELRRKRRKKIWRRIRRGLYVFIALMIIGPILAFLIAYQMVTVPSPNEVKANQSQVVTLQYAGGEELTRIAPEGANRKFVTYAELAAAPQVLNAVFAAEDNTFMSNAGFDLSGVLRAAYNQVTGGEGGGSTITQQYIKQATDEQDRTLVNKGIEVVKAYKMNRTYSKEQIIEAYLNTVYFGRNAYGIAAAAKAYYNKDDLKALTPAESALLAGMIQSPSRFKDEAYMQRRWNYVMDQLVANNWFPAAQRKAEQYPTPVPYEQTKTKALTGPGGHIQRAVFDELEAGPLKLTEAEIQRRGFTIVTTIDKTAQELAEKAVREVMEGQPDNLHPGLVAVDPKTGEIKAYYGGEDGTGTNWAGTKQEPGSSFKPFDLVALLQKGKGLGETYDGSSPRVFDGLTIRNSEGASCNPCTVAEAMKRSINTVFYDIAVNDVGTKKVAEAAQQAGIAQPWAGEPGAAPSAGISIGGDLTKVSTADMAAAYATFAARGIQRTSHIVAKVLNPDGSPYWTAQVNEKQAFDSDPRKNEKIARNVTQSLLPIPGYSKLPCADGRECAAKSGTHQLGETADNAKAWMVGYTPQLSTAVSMSGDSNNGDTSRLAIRNAQKKIIFGAGLPGQIWKKFMDSYHKTFKLPKEGFGRYEAIGKGVDSDDDLTSSSKKPTSKKTEPTTTTKGRPTDPPEQTTTRSRPRPTIPTFPTVSDPPNAGEAGG
ncbi:MAG TPA: transglycosylase domain-containing protein, partial [Actinophytocola sp.]|uniref:transglycosylase domain-containing protein n=1 Tax=Actinophytocola sp. TaxID=1872138 RepID=UPI002DDD474D